MHLGNIYAALMSWLVARHRGERWILRIEDLDPQRSRIEYARLIEDDLHWLGLDWDKGGIDGTGPSGPYVQSRRGEVYEDMLARLARLGVLYPCRCTRADIRATQAPHQSDGRVVYAGTCRPSPTPPWHDADISVGQAVRVYVPDRVISFTDGVFGPQSVNLASECGDFVIRRADGAWAYQLAVVADDALMGVTTVVRGCDLLLSAAQQTYLYGLLGLPAPQFIHLPLLCNAAGQRLSKRDASLSMEHLRARHTPGEVIGMIARMAGLVPDSSPISPANLLETFDPSMIKAEEKIIVNI